MRYERELPTAAEVRLVMEHMVKEQKKPTCDAKMAKGYATQLARFFPLEKGDLRPFIEGMAQLFRNYPEGFVKKVVDPVSGIAASMKFLPSIAEIKAALDVHTVRRDKVFSGAHYVEQERKLRVHRAEEAKLAAETPEQKQRAIDHWLKVRPAGKPLPPALAERGLESPHRPLETGSFQPIGDVIHSAAPVPQSAEDLRTPARPASDELKASVARGSPRSRGERWD